MSSMSGLLLALLLLQAEPPRAMRIAISPAETVAVSMSDGGSPVVLVPGLIGAGFTWRKVAPLLAAEGFRTVVVEPLGVGRSSRPGQADYSLGAQAGRVAAALDSLGLTRVVLVAHAVGGSIALRVAARRPDLVSGLLLVEAGVAENATTPGFRRAMKFAPLLRLFGGVGLIRGKVHDQLARDSGDPSWVDAAGVIDGYTADAASDLGATLRAYRRMADARERDSIAPHLPDIHVPVLLLLGGAPHSGGPRSDEIARLSTSLPDFAADTLSGVGHFPHEERPGAVLDAVMHVHEEAMLSRPAPPPALAGHRRTADTGDPGLQRTPVVGGESCVQSSRAVGASSAAT